MKKILIIGMLIALLLACGCAQKQKESPGITPKPTITPVDNGTGSVGSLTLEDLDQLKSNLEDLEFEGPGGLSDG